MMDLIKLASWLAQGGVCVKANAISANGYQITKHKNR